MGCHCLLWKHQHVSLNSTSVSLGNLPVCFEHFSELKKITSLCIGVVADLPRCLLSSSSHPFSSTIVLSDWSPCLWRKSPHLPRSGSMHACVLSCVQIFVTPWTAAHQVLCPWNSPGKNTGVGGHLLIQGIFLTQ